ncbi:hypothetical protein AC1031_009007 [Aphanomyces cochlioides]|nr:hypothetical protein AC1031_009007 [Aphanomyces cochlioides]
MERKIVSESFAEANQAKRPAGRRVTDLESMLLLEFLEKPKKFDLIVGKATKGKGVVGGQGLTKAHGYKLMATYINKNLREDVLRDWTGANAKGRFESYMRAFKAALKWEGGRDGGQSEGLTEKDFANGMCFMLYLCSIHTRLV